jgi:hypothetical protein
MDTSLKKRPEPFDPASVASSEPLARRYGHPLGSYVTRRADPELGSVFGTQPGLKVVPARRDPNPEITLRRIRTTSISALALLYISH